MNNLEKFINDDSFSDIDPLVKMAIIHHQFESIHPFSDGNGRTGRIINILYLVNKELLDLPVLYLSRFIIKNKGQYYSLLQAVRDEQKWEDWILFMLKGLEETALETVILIDGIKQLMAQYKSEIRSQFPRIYSQDLLNNLFNHPYTKIDFLCIDLNITRPTAVAYLTKLEGKFVTKMKLGRDNFYLNTRLFDLLIDAFHLDTDKSISSIESVG